MTTPMDTRQVAVQLSANTQPYQSSMAQAVQITEKLTEKTASLAKSLDRVVQSTARKMTLFGTGELAALSAAAEAANRLDLAFSQVRSTAAITGQSVGQLDTAARKLSQTLPMSTNAIAQLMGQVQDLGITGTANIVRFTKVAEQLAAATQTQPGQLLQGIIQLTRTMGSSYDNVERYSSALVTLAKQGGVTAQSVLDFSNGIEAVASRAGYTQTQVLGLSKAFAQAGANGQTAAQAFNKITTDISTAVVTGSTQLTTYANLIGTTREGLRKMAQDNPAEVFIRVVQALKDLGSQGLVVQQQLGLDNPRMNRVIAQITSGQIDLRAAINQSNDAFTKNTALSKSANSSYSELSVAFTRFRNSAANVASAIGEPLLAPMAKVVNLTTDVLNAVRGLPGPLQTVASYFTAIAASTAIAGGALVLLGTKVIKLGLLFRALTVQPVAQVFNGLRSSLTGTRELDPQYLEGRTQAMQRLYLATYQTGNALRGVATETRPGQASGNVLKSLARFPARKIGAEAREFWDTVKNPLPSQRDVSKTSVYSAAGQFNQSKEWFANKRSDWLNSEDERTKSMAQTIFGDPEAKAASGQNKIDARVAGIRAQQAKIRQVVKDLQAGDQALINEMMAAEHAKQYGDKRWYTPLDPTQITDQQRQTFIRQTAHKQGAIAGREAFDQTKIENSQEVSGIRAIFDKVKTMAQEIGTQTAAGTEGAFNAIKAGFSAAVEQIVALARVAQEELNNIRAGAGIGDATVAASTAAYEQAMVVAKKGLSFTQDAAKAVVTNAAPTAEAVAGKVGRTVASASQGAANFITPKAGVAVEEEGASALKVAEKEAAGHMSTFSQYLKIGGGAVRLTLGPLGKLAGGLAGLVGGPLPALILGTSTLVPILDHLAHAGRDAAAQMGAYGEQTAKALGLQWNVATRGKVDNPADNTPYGSVEKRTAQSGTFVSAHSADITRMGQAKTDRERHAVAQATIDGLIKNSNNGAPLTPTEQSYMRELMLNAYNGDVDKATQAYGQLNQTGSDAATQVSDIKTLNSIAARHAGGPLTLLTGGGINGRGPQSIIQANASAAAQQYALGGASDQNLAFLFQSANAGLKDHGGYQNTGTSGPLGFWNVFGASDKLSLNKGGQAFQSTVEAFANQVNKGVPKDQQLNLTNKAGQFAFNIDSMIANLKRGGTESQNFAKELQNTKIQLAALSAKFNAEASDPNSVVNRLGRSALGQMDKKYNLGLSGANVEGQDYPGGMSFALAMIGAQGNRKNLGNFDAASLGRQRTALRQQIQIIGNPGDAQSQDLSQRAQALTAGIMAQKNQFATASQAAQNYASEIGQVTSEMGTGASAQDAFNQAVGDFQGSVTQAEGQLRDYLQQVHDYHIQRQRGEQDHTTQLTRMYRDRGTQLTEINYQEGLRLKQQTHDFNEAIRSSRYELSNIFGGAAQQLEAQYTVGADTFLLGMDRQVQAMQRSKKAVDQLRSEGLSTDAIRVAGLDDPKQYEQAERLATDFAKSPKLVQAFNASIKGRLQIAEGLATDPNNAKFADMKRQFNYTADQAATAFKHSQTVSDQAFNTSLADFEQNYETANQRAADDLQRIGENLYTNLNQLLAAGLTTGVSNITAFTKGITNALNSSNTAITAFYANHPPAGSGGGGGGGTPGQFTTSGGPLVNAPPGGQSGSGSLVGDSALTIAQRSNKDSTTYVTPGTGAVVGNPRGGGITGDATGMNSAGANYRPSSDFMKKHPANPTFNQSIAHAMVSDYKWGRDEYNALIQLWNRESGWNQYADNPGSSAYGIPQALPGTKMSDAGVDWRTNPATQIKWGLDYIKGRYGDPISAMAHENKMGWYAAGGIMTSATPGIVGEAGPEAVIPLDRRGAEFMANILREFMPSQSAARTATSQTPETTGTGSTSMTGVIGAINTFAGTTKTQLAAILAALNNLNDSTKDNKPPPVTKVSPVTTPGVPISSLVPPTTVYPGDKPVLQPGQTGVPREGNGSAITTTPTGTTVTMPGTPAPTSGTNVGWIDGSHNATAVPNVIGGPGTPGIANTVVPVQHPNAQGVPTSEKRALASFDATSQATLKRGGKVTAGDGRIYAMLNGQPTVVGFNTDLHNAAGFDNFIPYTPIINPATNFATGVGGATAPVVANPVDNTPLPPRSPTTDRSVTSVKESTWTDRQRRYAALYHLHGLALGGRAIGNMDKPYLVGENGPELFLPTMSGQVVRNSLTMNTLNMMRQQPFTMPVMASSAPNMHSESHDNSMHVHGDVHVEANDSAQLMRAMQQKKRLTNLAKQRG